MTWNATVLAVAFAAVGAAPVASQERHQQRFDGPQPTRWVMPDYPPVVISACVQGTASVVVELDQGGKVIATDFIAGAPLLEKAVVEASRQWLFEPTSTVGRRRQVLRFSFAIVPRRAPKRAAISFSRTPTDVEVRSYWISVGSTCSDCSQEASRRWERESEKPCTG